MISENIFHFIMSHVKYIYNYPNINIAFALDTVAIQSKFNEIEGNSVLVISM